MVEKMGAGAQRAAQKAGATEEILISRQQWIQNLLIINSWQYKMEGGRVFRTMGIKEGGERVINVTRIIT